ncbi:MAG: hypothetical protein GXP42_10855 [Chloroflexi bacterium]|nr:hypothetical protein [Chloroflexota bacterium]
MSWINKIFGREATPPPTGDSPPELEAELIEAEQFAKELPDYLLSDRLFWQIVVDTPLGARQPKMTLGSLFERMQHLASAPALGPKDRERLKRIQEAWDIARKSYPQQFKQKLRRELDSYLHNWKYYLEQRRGDPERWKEDYEVELRNRRRVELVVGLLGPDAPPGLLEELKEWEKEALAEET